MKDVYTDLDDLVKKRHYKQIQEEKDILILFISSALPLSVISDLYIILYNDE